MKKIQPIREAFVMAGTNEYGPALYVIVPEGKYGQMVRRFLHSAFVERGFYVDSSVHENRDGETVIVLQFDPEIDEDDVTRIANEV